MRHNADEVGHCGLNAAKQPAGKDVPVPVPVHVKLDCADEKLLCADENTCQLFKDGLTELSASSVIPDHVTLRLALREIPTAPRMAPSALQLIEAVGADAVLVAVVAAADAPVME